MKPENAKAIEFGELVKYQMFNSATGFYQIELIRYDNDIFFVKKLNGKVVECCNLNKAKARYNDYAHGDEMDKKEE